MIMESSPVSSESTGIILIYTSNLIMHGHASSCGFNNDRTDKKLYIYFFAFSIIYNKLKLILLIYHLYFLEVSFKLKLMDNNGGVLLVPNVYRFYICNGRSYQSYISAKSQPDTWTV